MRYDEPSGTGLLPPRPGFSRPLPPPLTGLSRPLPPWLSSAVGLSGPAVKRFFRARSRCQLSCLLQQQGEQVRCCQQGKLRRGLRHACVAALKGESRCMLQGRGSMQHIGAGPSGPTPSRLAACMCHT